MVTRKTEKKFRKSFTRQEFLREFSSNSGHPKFWGSRILDQKVTEKCQKMAQKTRFSASVNSSPSDNLEPALGFFQYR